MKLTPATTRTVFRSVAIAEAISWAGLLVGVYLKRVSDTTELGVQIFGPIHGAIFVTYVVMCFLARRAFGWSLRATALALAAGIPPFFTYVFEVVADRRGLLGQATADRSR